MEVLHIIPAQTGNITEFLRMAEKEFDLGQHKFMTLVARRTVIRFCPELLAFPFVDNFVPFGGSFRRLKDYLALRRRLKKADRIIWHSLSIDRGSFVLLLFLNPDLCRKSVWIESGADEEIWDQYPGRIKNRINNFLQRAIRRRIPVVGLSSPANRTYVLSLWPKKQLFDCPYPINEAYLPMAEGVDREAKRQALEDVLRRIEAGDDTIDRKSFPYIQIGLSSSSMNRHDLVLGKLEAFRDAPLNVCVPLSFRLEKLSVPQGSGSYAIALKTLAASRSHNLVLMSGSMRPDSFSRYLSHLYAVMLGETVSFGYSYLLILLAAGVKIYLPESSCTYRFLSERNVLVSRLESVPELSLEDFLRAGPAAELPAFVAAGFDRRHTAGLWSKLFQSIEKKA